MTGVFLFDLAISQQGHVFAVTASTDVSLAPDEVRPMNLEGFASILAAVDGANVADDHFIGGHDLKLLFVPASESVVSVWLSDSKQGRFSSREVVVYHAFPDGVRL
jgi:hypothetical protein